MQENATAEGGIRSSGVLAFRASAVWRALAATVTLVGAAAATYGSLLLHPNSRLLSGFNDAALAMRMYDVTQQEGATPFTFEHDRFNGAPEGLPVLPAIQFAAPIQSSFVWLSKGVLGITGAVNLFMLAGVLLTGLAMFLLLDRCRFGFLPSLFAALLVAFNPWMYERSISGHIAFSHGWVLILLLFTLLRLREERSVRRAAVAGGAYGLCFLMASYSGFLATALVAGFVIVDLAFARSRTERLWTATLLVGVFGVMTLFLLPGAVAYATKSEGITRTLTRTPLELKLGGASPLHYLLPSPRHPLVGSWTGDWRPWDFFNEKTLFFGFTTIALALVAAWSLVHGRRATGRRSRRTELGWLALASTPVALVLSFGPYLTVAGRDIPMPGYLIGEVTTFYRIYARLGFAVAIGLAILAAFALGKLQARRFGTPAVIGLMAFAAIELLPGRVDLVKIDAAPVYDRWLASQPEGIVAHYPMMTNTRQAEHLAVGELYFQRFTGLRLFEIYGPERGGTREDAIRLLARYLTSEDTPGILAAEGVRYVVVHDDVYRAQGEAPPDPGRRFRLLRRFDDVGVYELRARPVNLERALARGEAEIAVLWNLPEVTAAITGAGFHGGERYLEYEDEWRWMKQGGVVRLENKGDKTVQVRLASLAFANGETRTLELRDVNGDTVASATVHQDLRTLEIGPFEVPPGVGDFTLAASPGPSLLGPDRAGSVFLAPFRAYPVPDYSVSLAERRR